MEINNKAPKPTKMEQFLKSKGMKEKTIKTYISIINKVTKVLGKEFNQKELEDYLGTLNLKPSSYNLYRAVMNFYTGKELGYKITFSKSKKDSFLPIEVSRMEFHKFLSTIPFIKHRAGFRLMYESGLRVDEVVNVKKHNLQFNKLTLRIRGKGSKDRYTILNKDLIIDLKKLIEITDKNNPYLFQNHKTHLTTKTFQERLNKAKKDSKLTNEFTCHSLRHSFAINLVNNGIDIDIIRKLLGHSSIKTTQIYLQCRTIDLTRIAEVNQSPLPRFYESKMTTAKEKAIEHWDREFKSFYNPNRKYVNLALLMKNIITTRDEILDIVTEEAKKELFEDVKEELADHTEFNAILVMRALRRIETKHNLKRVSEVRV